jgi:hypothetical protein
MCVGVINGIVMPKQCGVCKPKTGSLPLAKVIGYKHRSCVEEAGTQVGRRYER